MGHLSINTLVELTIELLRLAHDFFKLSQLVLRYDTHNSLLFAREDLPLADRLISLDEVYTVAC